MDASTESDDHAHHAHRTVDDALFVFGDDGELRACAGPGAESWLDDPTLGDLVAAARKSDRTPDPCFVEDGERVVRVDAARVEDFVVVRVADAASSLVDRTLALAYDDLGGVLAAIVEPSGHVVQASRSLRHLVGDRVVDGDLFGLVASSSRPRLLTLLTGFTPGAPPASVPAVSDADAGVVVRLQALDGTLHSIRWRRTQLGARLVLVGTDETAAEDHARLEAHRRALVDHLRGAPADDVLRTAGERLAACTPGIGVAVYDAPVDALRLRSTVGLASAFARTNDTLELPTDVEADALDGRLFPLAGAAAAAAARHDLGFAWVRFAIGDGRPIGAVVTFVGAKRFVRDDERLAIEALVEIVEGITRHETIAADAARDHDRDPLTGLESRASFTQRLADQPAAGRGALMIRVRDIDRVNGCDGVASGDGALQAVAAVLRSTTRERDALVRWTGTRFVVVATARRGAEGLAVLGQRVRDEVAAVALVGGQTRHVQCSVAVADARPGETVADLVLRLEVETAPANTVSGPVFHNR